LEDVVVSERPMTARPIVALKDIKKSTLLEKKKTRSRSKTTSPFRGRKTQVDQIFSTSKN